MPDEPRGLPQPRLEVTLDDGRVLRCQVLNPDMVRWDRTAAKHSWPTGQVAPILWLTFVAWAALKREGQIDGDLPWEEFSDLRCVAIRNLDQNGTEPVAVPTQPGPEPG